MGRKKKPAELEELQGCPGKRGVNKERPMPHTGVPRCPQELGIKARKIWRSLAKRLDVLGLLTHIDGMAFSILCSMYGTFLELSKDVKKEGNFIEIFEAGDDGEKYLVDIKKNPKLSEMRLLASQIKSYASEFGITPSSRSGIKTGIKEVDDIDDFMNRGKEVKGNIVKFNKASGA